MACRIEFARSVSARIEAVTAGQKRAFLETVEQHFTQDRRDETMELPRTEPVDAQELLRVLTALRNGDFSRLMPEGEVGIPGEIAETINTLVRRLNVFAVEVTRISREIGSEGRLGGQAEVEGLPGTWRDVVANFNHMAANLTDQVRDIARAARQMAAGNQALPVTVEAQGETRALKESLNTLIDRATAR